MLLPSRPRGPGAAFSSPYEPRRPELLPSGVSGGRPQRHPCSSGRRRRRSWPEKIRYEASVAVAVALGSGRGGGDGESRTLKAISLRRGCELRFASLLSSRFLGLSSLVAPRQRLPLSPPQKKARSYVGPASISAHPAQRMKPDSSTLRPNTDQAYL